jgi:hypothetical protein
MLLGYPDVHHAFSGTANAEVEFVDVAAGSPFDIFVRHHVRQEPNRFRLSRVSMVRTRREAAFCSDIIRESDRIPGAPANIKPLAPDHQQNADFCRGLDFFNNVCVQTFQNICDHAKVILAWHGTNVNAVESVCTYGPRAFRKTDGGYFGAGSYFAVECAYASRYSEFSDPNDDGEFAVILFACYLAPFPYVITLQDDYNAQNAGPWDGFSSLFSANPHLSKSLKPLYNAHFAPVRQCGQNHPVTGQPLAYDPSAQRPHAAFLDYQACPEQDAQGHELILADHRQALPVAVLWYRH